MRDAGLSIRVAGFLRAAGKMPAAWTAGMDRWLEDRKLFRLTRSGRGHHPGHAMRALHARRVGRWAFAAPV
jgi:hypothetical protein